MQSELKPCPFCGGNGDYLEGRVWLIRCDNCGADAESHETREGAAANWNRRAAKSQNQAIKPLEWEEGYAFCYNFLGFYHVGYLYGRRIFSLYSHDIPDAGHMGYFDSEAEAKAAAQSDYEQRIRSALSRSEPENGGRDGE